MTSSVPVLSGKTTIEETLKHVGLWHKLIAVAEANHHDPHSVLGSRYIAPNWCLLVYRPHAEQVWCLCEDGRRPMLPLSLKGFFVLCHGTRFWGEHPSLIESVNGVENPFLDPYSFAGRMDASWVHCFNSGACFDAYEYLGAHRETLENANGVVFSVWAPNAGRVSVVGDFNGWDGRIHPMSVLGNSGIWELFIPGFPQQGLYKFEVRNRDSGAIQLKSDPYGKQYELRPDTASRLSEDEVFDWQDADWQSTKQRQNWMNSPLSIYELHAGSWRKRDDGRFLTYDELADQLIPYVKAMGFTHIELLPITEFPFDGSWGYQVTGFFAVTSRFGTLDEFKSFVNRCHMAGIGVLMDWVPAHFPKDAHGLARFDGSYLYEHQDPKLGEHKDWGTLIFNYGRNEVRNFLFSSARFWLKECHIDGLRVDAVASMLYLDYSRQPGEWSPNCNGGNENLDAIAFLQQLNVGLHKEFPGVLVMAEESTAWPLVSKPVYLGGLGFTMKWNMGWMNDSIDYMKLDPIYRTFHHNKLTFSMMYAFSENFILAFSHDEVVHGKYSMLEKMPGDNWKKFANLRLLYTYMFTHPGKKLLFMGDEFGQRREWCFDSALDWSLLEQDDHQGVQTLVSDLNRLYCTQAELHQYDFECKGFEWIDCHDSGQSVICFARKSQEGVLIVVLNFTPIVRYNYQIGVPLAQTYGEILNSDSVFYGGSNVSNGTLIPVMNEPRMGQPCSIKLTLPPLAGIVLKGKQKEDKIETDIPI